MPFIWDWIWEKLSGVSKTATEPKSLGGPEMDNQERKAVVRNRRAVPAKKGNSVPKPAGVRSNNTSKAGGKSAGKAVRAPASKSKSKSKAVPKG
jgi:hypothetical protein